jgi:hypothetical protein
MTTRQERAQERFRDRLDNGSIEISGQGVSSLPRTPETAREVLQSDEFFLHLGRDIARAGLVAERGNGIVTWLVGTSRIFSNPLNIIIKGSSGTGKNFMAKTVLKFFPGEEVVRASSLSQRSMNYVGRDTLAHKIFYVDEIGSVRTSHPARQLISEGCITHHVSVNEKGKWASKEIITAGPVACITTTTATALAIDDETRNLSVWIDESYAQTIRIAKRIAMDRPPIAPERLAMWHEVQRSIGSVSSVPIALPPWIVTLVERWLPNGDVRIRRLWPAFLAAVKTVCLVRKGWRGKKQIERLGGLTVDFEDFAIATHIFDRTIAQTLGRSGRDEDLATAEIVDQVAQSGIYVNGVSAGDLVGHSGIRSHDQAYRRLRRAALAGTIIQSNLREKNNEKRYMRSPEAAFLGDPLMIVRKLGLKIGGTYIHPLTGAICCYGKDE